MKEIIWLGSSRDDLKEFPKEARKEIGWELDLLQEGEEPNDFKPIKTVGAGVYEIRVRTDDGAYRAFYVAKFEEAVYVLHAFQKKTRQTAKQDIELGQKRYKQLLANRKNL
jgi:phage-related protein